MMRRYLFLLLLFFLSFTVFAGRKTYSFTVTASTSEGGGSYYGVVDISIGGDFNGAGGLVYWESFNGNGASLIGYNMNNVGDYQQNGRMTQKIHYRSTEQGSSVTATCVVTNCPDMPNCEKYTCDGCKKDFCAKHGNHYASGGELSAECKEHLFCGESQSEADEKWNLFKSLNAYICSKCKAGCCKACGHKCPNDESCGVECHKVQCVCGKEYCPVHDPAPVVVDCSKCGEKYCATHTTHTCKDQHFLKYGHNLNLCKLCDKVCKSCDSSHDCRSEHMKQTNHEFRGCPDCNQVCMDCNPSHDCKKSDHEKLYNHVYNPCGVDDCTVCKSCRSDHVHEPKKSHKEIYGHDFESCGYSECSLCNKCSPHKHSLSGKPVDSNTGQTIKPPAGQGGGTTNNTTNNTTNTTNVTNNTTTTTTTTTTTNPDGTSTSTTVTTNNTTTDVTNNTTTNNGGSGGQGESEEDEYSELILPALDEVSFTNSSNSLTRILDKLKPAQNFLTIAGEEYPSFTVPLDLSGAPFYGRDFTFVVGGWDKSANGKIVWAMSITRAISYFVFGLIFLLAVIKSLRQW